MDTLGVRPPPRPYEQLVNPFAAETRMPLAPATKFIDQAAITVRLPTTITLRRARLPQHTADPSFRYLLQPQAIANHLQGPPPSLGAYQFGRAASRRIWLSNAWSATNRFSRAFSFCNSCS